MLDEQAAHDQSQQAGRRHFCTLGGGCGPESGHVHIALVLQQHQRSCAQQRQRPQSAYALL